MVEFWNCYFAVRWQCQPVPTLATRLGQGPVHYSGPAAHWSFSIAGRISALYRMPGLCHLSTLQQRWWDSRAPGATVPSSRPGQERRLARRKVQCGPSKPTGLSWTDRGGDPPPPWPGMRESEHVGPAIVRSLTQVVTAWMGDCRSVNHLGNNQHQDQLCLPALCGREIEHLLVWLRLRQGMFTCVGWQVLLCDPVWQVTLGFFEMGFLWKLKKRAECLALCWFGGK